MEQYGMPPLGLLKMANTEQITDISHLLLSSPGSFSVAALLQTPHAQLHSLILSFQVELEA